MPKWDKSRNYYMDLDVHSSASTDEIRKQFRKLALKYHPDRNPGREAEVNPKFQLIQSAHEILTDDTLRRQYDEARRSTVRYPMASGVRGNPWQDIAKQYPPPPRRPQPPPRPSGGAQRYANFTNGTARPTRPTSSNDPQARKSNADAWDSMRSHAARSKAPPTPGRAPTSAARDAKAEAPPPRTAYQKQKAEAAFGSRRTGFTPRSPGGADEPPVTNRSNYFTTRTHSNIFTEMRPESRSETIPETTPNVPQPSAPVDPFEDLRERSMDGRKSTPYHSSGGEKTSLFSEGPGLSRTTSARAPPRKMDMPGAFPRSRARRSSSPKSSSNDGGSEDSSKVNPGLGATADRRASYSSSHFQTRPPPDRFGPKPEAPQPDPAATGSAPTEPTSANNGSVPSSGSTQTNGGPSVFNFCAANGSADKDAGAKSFSRSSTDNINTRFVEGEHPDDWQFRAGASSASEPYTPSTPRQQPRGRVTRRQVQKPRPTPTVHMPSAQESSEDTSKQGFSAGEWNEQIGSHHFEPQPSNSASSSPNRRTQPRKSKPVKMTAGTAGMVDEGESEGWQEIPQPSSGTTSTSASASVSAAPPSPNAMDIDSPAPENVEDTPKASHKNSARNIPVEPHRADWRAGNVEGVHSKSATPVSDTDSTRSSVPEPPAPPPVPAPAAANPFSAHVGGSEDSEEFCMKFTEFKKVEPFAEPAPTGLKSFSDLKSTLPFESRPSEQIPLEKEILNVPLGFPTPPVAPRLPPPMAVAGLRPNATSFRKYAQDFYNYMDKWEIFHSKIMLHFSTRQDNFKARRQQRGASWLDTSAPTDSAREYLAELDQDQAIHSQWLDAIKDHRKKIAEFTEFRDRVK